MDHQSVADFERRFMNILMRAMRRVPGLAGDDLFPSSLAKCRARLPRLARKFQERAPRYLFDQGDLARKAVWRHRGDVLRPRMRVLSSAEHVLRFVLAIDLVNFRELENRQTLSVVSRERDLTPGLQRLRSGLVDTERDWNTPRDTRPKPRLFA